MKNQTKFVIAGLGEILWDIYETQKFLGGAPANFALHIQKLGHHGLVLSKVGNDSDGNAILEKLHTQGIDTKYIQIDQHKPTGTVAVELDDAGIPSFTCTKDVAFDYLQDYSEQEELLQKIDALLFGTLAQRNDVSRNSIQNFITNFSAEYKVFDANLRGISQNTKEVVQFSLTYANILKLNDSEANLLPELLGRDFENEIDFFRYLLKQYQLELICLTLGENGALACSPHQIVYSPGFNVPVVDTTGSGDAFMAALIIAILEKKLLKDCLEIANSLGAFVATKKGAVPDYRRDQLHQIMKQSKKRSIDSKYEYFI